ncbi:hypothetical protein EDD22DRAFT_955783 [Suillus occidentalis]|nr:hypothetical protein EDD22DRAFT_955783 [Suillus occidentalis]
MTSYQSPSLDTVSESQQPLLDANALLEDHSSSTAHLFVGGGHFVETKGMDDKFMPNVRLMPDITYVLDATSDTFLNVASHLEDTSLDNTTLANSLISSNTSSAFGYVYTTMSNGLVSSNTSSALSHDYITMPNSLVSSNASSALGHNYATMSNDIITSYSSSVLGHDTPTMPNDNELIYTATLSTCDICIVLSAPNTPDPDPDPHTDNLIPQIDALLDTFSI